MPRCSRRPPSRRCRAGRAPPTCSTSACRASPAAARAAPPCAACRRAGVVLVQHVLTKRSLNTTPIAKRVPRTSSRSTSP
eukprot:scaffold74230_cov63-Phaeocystis_antarctica.AAC.2